MINYDFLKGLFYKGLDFHLEYLSDSIKLVEYYFKIKLYKNQEEILQAILDPKIKYILIMQARGGGKSFAVSLGLLILGIFHPNLSIGIFAPKEDQAIRLLNVIRSFFENSNTFFKGLVDTRNLSSVKLQLKNGSYFLAMSAHEQTLQEGWHFSVMCIDEAMRVSDSSMTTRLLPMLGSEERVKLIKIGIPIFKNHFYKSAQSSQYTKLIRRWDECDRLLESGYVVYKDKKISKYVLDRMPLSFKLKFFPDAPEFHYEGDMSEFDFKTQYNMEWAEDVSLVLTGDDSEKLIGDFLPLEVGRSDETYFFGLDPASGTLGRKDKELDFTALSIWRLKGERFEKVFVKEWQGDILKQIEEVKEILTNKFKCKMGCVDYSNVGSVFVEELKKAGIRCMGIAFNATFNSETGHNFKNHVIPKFIIELKKNNIKYPNRNIVENHVLFRKHYDQWCILERYKTGGTNDRIEAPSFEHDDGPMSDLLAFWAGLVSRNDISIQEKKYTIPLPKLGPSRIKNGLF
jgi:hypothetical protein